MTALLMGGQFPRLFPRLKFALLDYYTGAFEAACQEFKVNTPQRLAAFFAQVGHESSGLQYLEELGGPKYWAQYEGRADLGNVNPGDGVLYHGRGPIQLTGRANYAEFGKALSLPLEAKPDVALLIEVGARIAGRYWETHGCNELADNGDFLEITRRINGGLNGIQDRMDRWKKARKVFGLPEAA